MATNGLIYSTRCAQTFVCTLHHPIQDNEKHKENFIQFCMHPDMLGSMQFKVHHLLAQTDETRPLLRDPRLATVVLNAM